MYHLTSVLNLVCQLGSHSEVDYATSECVAVSISIDYLPQCRLSANVGILFLTKMKVFCSRWCNNTSNHVTYISIIFFKRDTIWAIDLIQKLISWITKIRLLLFGLKRIEPMGCRNVGVCVHGLLNCTNRYREKTKRLMEWWFSTQSTEI